MYKYEYNTQSNQLSLPQLVDFQTRKDAHLIAKLFVKVISRRNRIVSKKKKKKNNSKNNKRQNKKASERTIPTRYLNVFYRSNLYVMREMIVKSVPKNKTKQTNKKKTICPTKSCRPTRFSGRLDIVGLTACKLTSPAFSFRVVRCVDPHESQTSFPQN